ncbi:hypothetical protein CWE04_11905 [Thomasclavelia cocleata]|uniref:Uncharacterized protein n=1 Tax=Thomasclavelia cocleata TaxID=69824 RepID=A0A1I0BLH6_9FIRM|nr:hypothetical protein [Thomasclavelia cocleata]MCR1960193.1 hypothetical protein [Thomasclavelia cocleata]NDO41833.1 hypothetical protein [Thomasclavelia cocleata]PJN79906.1 hypothetical protein CWE04_11905 [Thomasclavelia cocleata]SET07706.1 hypothetical protein SAMN04489758_101172 [Thomasclavelia cocleata]
MKQNKIETLNKENQKLKLQLKRANEEIELLKNALVIKENFISKQKLKFYELMTVCEKRNKELHDAVKASRSAKINYENGLKIIKDLDKNKMKKNKSKSKQHVFLRRKKDLF